ncbi:probable SMC4-Stable Maintenance of Chromosomes [Claviceps purpurea 20.1]|uniref:Structural maintenance of chromosomes protein n=1 Tax=Claviceps purpurea (strain 20.1) TaxID=1111077 RepID=M1VU35_CLAP2|nr:probable SMC4-Stable Maintenance of Chromosomes [Claviceps purpurea 20.1]
MSATAPTRPSRRAATRRAAIVDSDDEDEIANTTRVRADEEVEYTPEPSRTYRRQTRSARPSVAPDSSLVSAPRRSRVKKLSRATMEPDELEGTPESIQAAAADMTIQQDPQTPPRQSLSKKRYSVASRASTAHAEEVVPPTLKKSASPEASHLHGVPLADITATSVNTGHNTDETPATVKPIKPLDTIMDNPLDIVLKSRTAVIPFAEEPSSKSRIVLTHLVLNNFKSYAGRQEVGPFHASFSSVVGPNGSGKSNVIDSLLFVFGFRASKMRQGKISALIHNSAQHPNLEYCEVEVHFQEVIDKPDGPETIPDSTLIISRKAFRNNTSKYFINGKGSDFTTVTTLLKDHGVDLDHKRFLILQGEVESIAQMKSKAANEHEDGLLEYLEDIIGTSKYKAPIEESAAEVETLNEVCAEKSGRVQHVEKEKNSLEDKKDKALAFVQEENELTLKQSALYQIFIHECNGNITVTKEAVSQMQALLDEELRIHQGSEQFIKDLEKQYSMGSKEVEVHEKQTQALVKELVSFEQERVKCDEKRKFLVDKRKKLQRVIDNAQNAINDADETIEENNRDIEARTREVAKLEEQVKVEEAELARIRDSLKGKTQAFSDKITVKQKAIEPWMEKINQKQSQIAVAESELNILKEKANAGAVAMGELEGKVASIEKEGRAKTQELKACEVERTKLEEEANKMASELAILAEQEPKMRAKVSNYRQKADEARSNLASTQARGNVLAALVRMKESGRIDGFHGRLGNLGTIHQKYDVAVSTACSALDNFVTESVESGQQCIEYLRKNNLGRGNFICLDKLKARDMSPIQTPENAPRLFDLVKAEDKFRPAFYHAMQDTLVASDLAQANRIAYGAKRWRVVTLAGELIDKSGTMSGGGSTVKKGLMSSKIVADISTEHVTKLEQERDKWEGTLQELHDYQRECESTMKDLKTKIPELETKMQKIRLDIESCMRNLSDTKKRIKEVSQEHQPSASDSTRIAALEKGISKLNAEIEQLRSETASVEAEIKALQDKIMEVGGEKLRSQRAKVDGLKAEINTNTEEMSNAEVRRVKTEKKKIKLAQDITKANKDHELAAQDLQGLEGDASNQGERAQELKTQVKEAETLLGSKREQLRAFKQELDDKTAELNKSRAAEIETRNKLEENQKILQENEKRLRYWHDKHSKLVLQNIEDLIGASSPAEKAAAAAGKTRQQKKPKTESLDSDDDDQDVEMTDAGADETEDTSMVDADTDNDPTSEAQPQNTLYELPQYTPDELAGMSKGTLKGEIAALEERTQNVNVDIGVLAEYRRRVEEHAARSSDLQSAISQRDAAKKRCDDLRRLRLEGFMEGFSTISLRLKEMYQMITMGGNAELELVDSLDPFSEGILFSVMPPKKSWKNISNLSGGEKTLSSLALVFALHHYKPTPLYVMDEIDAALDFRNVSIVANYIKERTKNAQFIVISLRNNMFELAARLVGVYKVNHMTKSVSIDNKDYIDRPQPQQQSQSQRSQTGLVAGFTTTLPLR